MDYSRYKYIQVERRDQVVVVTLNRPQSLNAINAEMHEEVEDIFEDLNRDAEVNAVVLTGAGRAFCAGGDIRGMRDREFSGPARPVTRGASRLVNNILNLEVPVVAAVNGDAIGLGATIALFCDVIYAAEGARIGDTHVRVGLVAGDGGAVIWPLLCGVAKAKELLMTGDLISAQEAERIGLVNKVFPKDEVLPQALELATRLAKGAPMAIKWTKHSVNKLLRDQVNSILDTSLALERISMGSEDHMEAARAFTEKREPKFTGR